MDKKIKALRAAGWYRGITGNFVHPKNEKYITEKQLAEISVVELKKLLEEKSAGDN